MENNKTVSFKVEYEKWTKLKLIALKKNMKLNQILEEMLNDFLRKEEDNE